MTTGYSGTPLAKKLTLKDGMRVWTKAMPATVRAEIDSARLTLTWARAAVPGLEAAHLFTKSRAELRELLTKLRPILSLDGMVWVSWPKKSAGIPTDITEDTIRDIALPMGFVDIKVCAVDETWSGLKLVIRKENRR